MESAKRKDEEWIRKQDWHAYKMEQEIAHAEIKAQIEKYRERFKQILKNRKWRETSFRKSGRVFSEFDTALELAKEKGGIIRRKRNGWGYYPPTMHPFDALSDSERRHVRMQHLFRGKFRSWEEIRGESWNFYCDYVFAIISNEVKIDKYGNITPKETYEEVNDDFDPNDESGSRFISEEDYFNRTENPEAPCSWDHGG
jgi:hypothetical protein